MADPVVKIIRTPKTSNVMMIGSNQYFFRTLRNPHKSRKKSTLALLSIRMFQILGLECVVPHSEDRRIVLLPFPELQ